jgi:hypothetical protein
MPNTYTGVGWREHKMNENPSNEFFFCIYGRLEKWKHLLGNSSFEALERNIPTQPWYKVGMNFELWVM